MRGVAILLAALAATPAGAQGDAGRGAPPSERELSGAADTLSVFVSALNSRTLGAETKAGLLRCLYANSLGTIARQEAKVFAANKTADMKSPSQRLFVVAKLCSTPITSAAAMPEKQ